MPDVRASRRAIALRIYLPVLKSTMAAIMGGDALAVEKDPIAAAMLAVIRGDNPLGDFGLYHAVVEIVPALESFRPAPGSRAVQGEIGKVEHSPTAIICTYLPDNISDEELEGLVARLMDVHPWQAPVIEMSDVRLLTR